MTSSKAKPKLLTGGNPQIAKGDGDAPVQAHSSLEVLDRCIDFVPLLDEPQTRS